MDWKLIIADLMNAGVTQVEMASHCDCGQSTISEIYRGEIKNPAWRIGSVLVDLHRQHCLGRKNRKAA